MPAAGGGTARVWIFSNYFYVAERFFKCVSRRAIAVKGETLLAGPQIGLAKEKSRKPWRCMWSDVRCLRHKTAVTRQPCVSRAVKIRRRLFRVFSLVRFFLFFSF